MLGQVGVQSLQCPPQVLLDRDSPWRSESAMGRMRKVSASAGSTRARSRKAVMPADTAIFPWLFTPLPYLRARELVSPEK